MARFPSPRSPSPNIVVALLISTLSPTCATPIVLESAVLQLVPTKSLCILIRPAMAIWLTPKKKNTDFQLAMLVSRRSPLSSTTLIGGVAKYDNHPPHPTRRRLTKANQCSGSNNSTWNKYQCDSMKCRHAPCGSCDFERWKQWKA
jgi:hypothetical protein